MQSPSSDASDDNISQDSRDGLLDQMLGAKNGAVCHVLRVGGCCIKKSKDEENTKGDEPTEASILCIRRYAIGCTRLLVTALNTEYRLYRLIALTLALDGPFNACEIH